jgi:outer membrane protein assembly factor BamB
LINWSGRTTHAYAVATGRPLWSDDGIEAAGAGLALAWDGPSLVALDLQTGAERWRATVARAPVVAGAGSVAVIGSTISVFDARTGSLRWSAPAPTLGAPYNGNAAIGAGALIVPTASPSYEPYVE